MAMTDIMFLEKASVLRVVVLLTLAETDILILERWNT